MNGYEKHSDDYGGGPGPRLWQVILLAAIWCAFIVWLFWPGR